MDINKINPNTNINPLGEEIYLKSNNSNLAVLLIHGFSGKSSNWQYIADKLHQELDSTIYVPRLPGHGTNFTDFLNSSAEQWLRKVIDSYLFLKNNFKKIYIAGLSMGGLLAALTASQFEVEKLSLIAPAFFTRNKNIIFTPYLKYFIKKIDNNFSLNKKNLNENELQYHQNYSYYYYTSTLAELYKLMKKAKKNIDKIETPTQLILSKNDEQVATEKISAFLNKKMGKYLVEEICYQKSSHVIINDTEKNRCATDILNFFT